MREKYESLALTDLKAIAKSRGIKGTSTMKKAEVVEAMLKMDSQESQKAVAEGAAVQGEESGRPVGAERPAQAEKAEGDRDEFAGDRGQLFLRKSFRDGGSEGAYGDGTKPRDLFDAGVWGEGDPGRQA